jgi:UDP-glucoronosyl and UDP-glucosyl transferase
MLKNGFSSTTFTWLLYGLAHLGITGVDTARILMMAMQQSSHLIVTLNIGAELISYGHEIYIILASEHPMAETFRRNGIKVVTYQRPVDVMYPFTDEYIHAIAGHIFNRTREADMVCALLNKDCDAFLSNNLLINDLKALNCDLMIVEPFVVNPCYLLMPYLLGLRYISTTSFCPPWFLRLPAVPSFFASPIIGPELVQYPVLTTLAKRLASVSTFAMVHIILSQKYWSDMSFIQSYAPAANSWNELLLQSELVLIQNDYHLDSAIPLLPHVVTVSGITARPAKPLPDELEEIMNQSGNHGVILASFGTIAFHMPADVVIKFLEAFGRLKQTVLVRLKAPAGFKASIFRQYLLVQYMTVRMLNRGLQKSVRQPT